MPRRRSLISWLIATLCAASGIADAAPEGPEAAHPLFSQGLRQHLELTQAQLHEAIGLIERYRARAAVRQASPPASGSVHQEARRDRAKLQAELKALLNPQQRVKLAALKAAAAPAELARQAACEGFIDGARLGVDDSLQCTSPAGPPVKGERPGTMRM